MLQNLPLKNPTPDSKRFVDVLMGRQTTARPPLVEYLVDETLMEPIVTDLLGLESGRSHESNLNNFIEFWHRLGYDFVRFEQALGFPTSSLDAPDTAEGSEKMRSWSDEHGGTITSWEDFESYRWPKVSDFDFSSLEYLNHHLREGMGLISCHAGGIFENVSSIFSLERLCFLLHDDPELVQAVADNVGERMVEFYSQLLELDRLVCVLQGDDMGFRTGTMISPEHLRQYSLPWHKRFAEMAHDRGMPYFLHSCGNIVPIMDDLINDVGFDGKHSYEDAILPIDEFQEIYGDRIAVLGGVDVDVLSRESEDGVRKKTRELIDICGARGRFAVGSGSSIPSYVSVDNYLAMVDEALNV
jgi:uroporphyrinogen decarboxylase